MRIVYGAAVIVCALAAALGPDPAVAGLGLLMFGMAEEAAKKSKDKSTPIRRITIKTGCANGRGDFKGEVLGKVLKDKAKAVPLMRVYGVATRMKPGESDFGPYLRFLGQFRALNIETGEAFRAPVLLLPKFLEEELAGAMGSGENVRSSEFAIEIS